MINPIPPDPPKYPSDPGSPPLARGPVKFRPYAVLVGLVLGAACVALELTGPNEDAAGALWVGGLMVLAGLALDVVVWAMRKRGAAT